MGYESLHIMELLSVQCLQLNFIIPIFRPVPFTVFDILRLKLKKNDNNDWGNEHLCVQMFVKNVVYM